MTTTPISTPTTSSPATSSGNASPALADRILYCKTCKDPFVFSVGEQRFFQEKGLQNDPAHCPDCRRARRHGHDSGHRKARGAAQGRR